MVEALLETVGRLGFVQKQEFKGDWKVMSAVELGILMHVVKDYRGLAYGTHISKTWLQRAVKEESDLVRKHTYDGGLPSPHLLTDITRYAEARLVEMTREKPHHLSTIQLKRDLPLENNRLVEEMMGKVKVWLAVIEQTEDRPLVRNFPPEGEQNIIMPVVILLGDGKAVLLEHRDFQGQVRAGFPFVMGKNESITCLPKGPLDVIQPAGPSRANEADYDLAKYNVTAVLSNFLVQALPEGVPSLLTQQYSEVCEVLHHFLRLQSLRAPLPFAGELQTICGLSSLPHTLQSCVFMGREPLLKLACGHEFHVSCLRHHLTSNRDAVLRTPRPVFYCPLHHVPLTDKDLLQVEPEIVEILQSKRRDSLIKW